MASAAPQSGGIQLLLQAEQDAQRIISDARAGMFTAVVWIEALKRPSLYRMDLGIARRLGMSLGTVISKNPYYPSA